MKKIPLGKSGLFAIVDDADCNWLIFYKWTVKKRANGQIMAVERVPKLGAWKRVYMHRYILGASGKDVVDHIDGNPLNNTRENIRICAHADNMKNRRIHKNNASGYKGVAWHKKTKKYSA